MGDTAAGVGRQCGTGGSGRCGGEVSGHGGQVSRLPEVLGGSSHPTFGLRQGRRSDHLQGLGLQQSRVRIQHPDRQRRDQRRPGLGSINQVERTEPSSLPSDERPVTPGQFSATSEGETRVAPGPAAGTMTAREPGLRHPAMIRAIIFDLDNTLTDFMKMKRAAIEAAVDGMLDAGLTLRRDTVAEKIFAVYEREGIEYQQVFDLFLKEELGRIDYKIMTSAIIAYRRARDSYLVL